MSMEGKASCRASMLVKAEEDSWYSRLLSRRRLLRSVPVRLTVSEETVRVRS